MPPCHIRVALLGLLLVCATHARDWSISELEATPLALNEAMLVTASQLTVESKSLPAAGSTLGVSCFPLGPSLCDICVTLESTAAGECEVDNSGSDNASVLVELKNNGTVTIAVSPRNGTGDEELVVSASLVQEITPSTGTSVSGSTVAGVRSFFRIASHPRDVFMQASLCDSDVAISEELIRFSPRVMLNDLTYPFTYDCMCDLEVAIFFAGCYFDGDDSFTGDFCLPLTATLSSSTDAAIVVVDFARIDQHYPDTPSMTYELLFESEEDALTVPSAENSAVANSGASDDSVWVYAPLSVSVSDNDLTVGFSPAEVGGKQWPDRLEYALFAAVPKQGTNYAAQFGVHSSCYLLEHEAALQVSVWVDGTTFGVSSGSLTAKDFFDTYDAKTVVNVVVRDKAEKSAAAYQAREAEADTTPSVPASPPSHLHDSGINAAWYVVIPLFGIALLVVIGGTVAILYAYMQSHRRAPEFSRLIN